MVLHHLDIPKALGPHDAEHRVRLTDAHFKIEPAAGGQGRLPLFTDGPVKVQAVLPILIFYLNARSGRFY